jgi:hypothetical protein
MNGLTYGPMREPVDTEELQRLSTAGAIFLDPRRSRPLWFDGRFLKAQDLNREQNYFLVRQADLATATGTGVIEGLMVEESRIATRLIIRRGHGVTVGGERVVVDRDLEIDLANIPLIQRLNVVLRLSREPAPPLRNRTGLFVVILRALEFTANPIASYPTSVDGSRSVEDGETIEATAVSLVPYSLTLGVGDPVLRRAEAAYRIFATGGGFNAPPSSLPLALVELERGMVKWVDNFLIRREMGSAHSDVLGFGMAPRPVREAFLRQYLEMLDDVVAQRTRLNAGLRFAATEHFLALPSAGRLPSAAIDVTTGTQHFFPAAMDVEISFVPEDEIPLLVEESMVLPPLDLTATEEVQETTSVLVLVPVARHQLPAVMKSLPKERLDLAAPVTLLPSRLKPVAMLDVIRTRLPSFIKPEPQPTVPLAEQWLRELVASAPFLWYVRRRNLSYKASVTGEGVKLLPENEIVAEKNLMERVKRLGMEATYKSITEKGSAASNYALVKVLASERFDKSDSFTVSALQEMEKAKVVDERTVFKAAESFNDPNVGAGMQKLEEAVKEPETPAGGAVDVDAAARNAELVKKIADTGMALELDAVSRRLPPQEFEKFSSEVKSALDKPTPQAKKALTKLISEKSGSVTP